MTQAQQPSAADIEHVVFVARRAQRSAYSGGSVSYLGWHEDNAARIDKPTFDRVIVDAAARETLIRRLGEIGRVIEYLDYHPAAEVTALERFTPDDNELGMGIDGIDSYLRYPREHGSPDACANALLLLECVRLHVLERDTQAHTLVEASSFVEKPDGETLLHEMRTLYFDYFVHERRHVQPAPRDDDDDTARRQANTLLTYVVALTRCCVATYRDAAGL